MPKPAARKCRYCKATFQPKRDHALFCCEEHRMSYWQHGKMPFHKLLTTVEKHAREAARDECRRLIEEWKLKQQQPTKAA